jgi:hypothetical protein
MVNRVVLPARLDRRLGWTGLSKECGQWAAILNADQTSDGEVVLGPLLSCVIQRSEGETLHGKLDRCLLAPSSGSRTPPEVAGPGAAISARQNVAMIAARAPFDTLSTAKA